MFTITLPTVCTGVTYHALLDFVASRAERFYLVDQFGVIRDLNAWLLQSQPFLIASENIDAWPGTSFAPSTLHIHRIFYYVVSKESIHLLKTTTTGLYDWSRWRDPPLPEDLGFIRSDGSLLMASISHEHDAWLELSSEEFSDFETMANRQQLAFSVTDAPQTSSDSR